VLLLEAGPDYPDPEGLPADLRDGTRNSMRSHDWGQLHRPRPSWPLLWAFPRGRVVGGSSAVNTCIALRGDPEDYDEWAGMGLPDWAWEACLPAFRRLENDLDFRTPWHSQDGPVPIRRASRDELGPWQVAFLEACDELGYPRCDDSNDPTTTGASLHAMNIVDGVRMSAARCYLTAAVRRRPNLRVRPHTLVRRVLTRDRRVVGVEVETHGRVHTIASRRVILCAGATSTPGILLRSGVGPRAAVERLGAEVVREVPAIAARLLDHPGAAIFLRPHARVHTPGSPFIQTVLRYASSAGAPRNDMFMQPGSIVPLPFTTLPLVNLMISIGKPRGEGTIEFRSASARSRPRIESRLLLDPADHERAVDGLLLAADLARSRPMRSLASFFWPPPWIVRDKQRLGRFIGRVCDSSYHPCGTVPMGEGTGAATDGRGRVRGVEGLFVADASLMPTIPRVHTNLTALMIGERFGEWLREGGL
jgi:choline dehydrogenase